MGKRPANVTIRTAPFSAAAPLQIPRCGYSDFCLYHISPIFKQSGSAFLGEVGKWVPVSIGSRVSSVHDTTASLTVEIVGEAAESVELVFAKKAKKGTTKPVSVLCKIGVGGTATASFDGAAAKCTSSAPLPLKNDDNVSEAAHPPPPPPPTCPDNDFAAGNCMRLVTMTEKAKTDGAVCLDGSPGVFYWHPATDPKHKNDWILSFKGDGWCFDAQDCLGRSRNSFGGSDFLSNSTRGTALKLSTFYVELVR